MSASSAERLAVGVPPYAEPLQLLRLYRPLAQHLQQDFAAPALIKTRGDFGAYLAAVGREQFDLAILPAHLARYSTLHTDYRPIVGFAAELRFVAVLPAGAALEDLRSAAPLPVAVPAYTSQSALVAEDWLGDVLPGQVVKLRTFGSHTEAVAAVARGEAALAVTATTILPQLQWKPHAELETVDTGVVLPHLVLLCRPGRRVGFCDDLAASLRRFEASEPGQAFFQASAMQGLAPVPDLSRYDHLLQRLEPHLQESAP